MKKTMAVVLLLALACLALPLSGAFAAFDTIELPVPGEGETLYIGSAEYDEAGSFAIAFVLTADGTAVREIVVMMEDVSLEVREGSSITKVSMSSARSRYAGEYSIDPEGIADAGNVYLEDIEMLDDTITATLHYTYTYYGSNRTGYGPGTQTQIPFAPQEVTFEKQD